MDIRFDAGSSQYTRLLVSALPTTWSTGMWVFVPASVNGQEYFAVTNVGANNGFDFAVVTSNLYFGYYNGSSNVWSNTSLVHPLGEWFYVLYRHISTTNRRITVLRRDQINSVQSTTSSTPSAMTQLSHGCYIANTTPESYFSGSVGEWFMATGDVQADGGVVDTALVHRIAYRGPWSVPHIVPLISDYASFRAGFPTSERYHRGAWRDWTMTNGPTTGGHPPLAGDYVRPNQTIQPLLV